MYVGTLLCKSRRPHTTHPDVYAVHTTHPDVYAVHTTHPDVYAVHTTHPDVYAVHITHPDVYAVHTTHPDVYAVHTTHPDMYVVHTVRYHTPGRVRRTTHPDVYAVRTWSLPKAVIGLVDFGCSVGYIKVGPGVLTANKHIGRQRLTISRIIVCPMHIILITDTCNSVQTYIDSDLPASVETRTPPPEHK